MVNNKYVKTVNGVLVQCWKKKENPGPHDNILVAGTYKWVDTLDFSSITRWGDTWGINFTSNSLNYNFILVAKNNGIPRLMYGSNVVAYKQGWNNTSYKNIVLNSDQQINSLFYDWAITHGNLVYQGS